MQFNFKDKPCQLLTEESLIRHSFLNNQSCFKQMLSIPNTSIYSTPALEGVVTNLNSHLFNMFFENKNIQFLNDDELEHIKRLLGSTPYCIELTDTVPDCIHQLIKIQNPNFISVSTRIYHDINRFPKAENHTANNMLEIKLTKSENDFHDWLSCFEKVWPNFGSTKIAFQKWISSYGFDPTNSMQNFICYRDKKPVGIASLLFDYGVVGPFSIAVIPQAQKSGVGNFVVGALAGIIKNCGYRYVVGSGSEDGIKLYEKFNIIKIGTTTRYFFN